MLTILTNFMRTNVRYSFRKTTCTKPHSKLTIPFTNISFSSAVHADLFASSLCILFPLSCPISNTSFCLDLGALPFKQYLHNIKEHQKYKQLNQKTMVNITYRVCLEILDFTSKVKTKHLFLCSTHVPLQYMYSDANYNIRFNQRYKANSPTQFMPK